MCFSAGASFGAAGVLTVTGVITNTNVQTPKLRLLALVPWLFAAQQLAEGFLWLGLGGSLHGGNRPAIYSFLLFAQVVWPVWVPLSLFNASTHTKEKGALFLLCLIGACCSLLLCYRLIFGSVGAYIEDCHIVYDISSSKPVRVIAGFLYFVSILTPLFVSRLRYIRGLGALLIVSLLVSYFFFEEYLISVWCFFAAALSVMILVVIRKQDEVPRSD